MSAGVVRERVSFDSDGVRLVGTLHLPDGAKASPAPVVVVTGSWLTVKEQMADTYARRLTADGLAALTA
jgi:dienelactone hydrolase